MGVFKDEGIDFLVIPDSPTWRKTDGMKPRGYSKVEMEAIFNNCGSIYCKSLFDLKLWLCPRILHAVNLDILKKNEAEYIDLVTCSKDDFWVKIRNMHESPLGVTGCFYCLGTESEEVPAARQA